MPLLERKNINHNVDPAQWSRLKIKINNFVNLMTGLNTWKDRKTQNTFQAKERLEPDTVNAMYKDSPLTANIVNCIVDDALRKSLSFDHEQGEDLLNDLENLKLFSYLMRGAKTGRQTGHACVFFNVNDGNVPEKPVNLKTIRNVSPGFIANKYNLTPYSMNEKGGPVEWIPGAEIEFYSLRNSKIIFHKSRVLEFKGIYKGEDNLNTNKGFYESVIDSNRKAILFYELFGDSVTTLTDNVIQEVLMIDGLEKKLKGNKSEVFNFLQSLMMGKSVVNKLVIDKKDEFKYHSANLSGYEKISDIIENYVSMSSRIPGSKLFGKSPSASIGSQAGYYEDKLWINDVETYQQNELKPEINKVISWIKALRKIPETEVIIYSFPSLFPIDPKTDSEIRKNQSITDRNYIDKGVVKAEEIALSRFKSKWSMDTQINLETREKALNNG